MSGRPWPEGAEPTAEQLLEWFRTGTTADVLPDVQQLLDNAAAMVRVDALLRKWRDEELYGPWHRAAEYRHRVYQLTTAINPPTIQGDQS